MAFEIFKARVSDIAARNGLSAEFEQSDGKHIAFVSDGTKVIGNAISNKVTLIWGSGHQATACL